MVYQKLSFIHNELPPWFKRNKRTALSVGELVDIHILACGRGCVCLSLTVPEPNNAFEGLLGLWNLYLCSMPVAMALRFISDQPLTTYF